MGNPFKNLKRDMKKKKGEEMIQAEQKPSLSIPITKTEKGNKDRGVLDITSTHVYTHYPPSQRIEGKAGIVKALTDIYGPNFVGGKHNEHFQNVRTGHVGTTHHCRSWKGEHTLRRDCFTSGHQLYCPEFVDRGAYRVRCGERLTCWSEGCGNPEHRTKLPGSMAKAMQDVFEGDCDHIQWGQLNDPQRMKLDRIVQAKALPPIEEIEEKQAQQLEDYIAENDMDYAEDAAIYSTYKVWEERKAQTKMQTKTDAALAKQLDEMTLAALASKKLDPSMKDQKAYTKAWEDTRTRLQVQLESGEQREADRPVNLRLAALEEKAANGGKAAKGKGGKANTNHHRFGIGSKKDNVKPDAERGRTFRCSNATS